MKAFTRSLLAAALTLVCSGVAMATPSGQIWIPSTDAKGFKEVNISIDNYVRFSDNANAGSNYYNAGVTVGVLPFEKFKLEIGVDFLTDGGGSVGAQHPAYFNFKGAIPEDAFFKGQPAVAAGMFGIGTFDRGATGGNTTSNIAYGLVAKTLPVVGRFSVGGYHGAEKNLGTKQNVGLLASWDRTISEISDKLWLGVDYMSGNNAFGAISVGAAWTFTPNVSVLVGANVYNPGQTTLYGGKPTFTTQLDINF
ncbi:hypothetical protein [Trichlorobacter ammonificans]|uniref:Transporter n=1 Tax=Trichlorobacter ammonificans TaxID=2916410 RepID=A0ABN8HM17_9BACT|nr:hypothetical protein [Trichlorobacter ammonificans]CAH2032639.1 conserved exported protein of unknown function [Trichlorobacter ammonificans]